MCVCIYIYHILNIPYIYIHMYHIYHIYIYIHTHTHTPYIYVYIYKPFTYECPSSHCVCILTSILIHIYTYKLYTHVMQLSQKFDGANHGLETARGTGCFKSLRHGITLFLCLFLHCKCTFCFFFSNFRAICQSLPSVLDLYIF
jgi:hypothetical protein